jgi:aminomethyltransferase
MYQETSGKSVPAVVSEVPFVASAHPGARAREHAAQSG